ncbi:MAG TPA: hypothetical protein VFB73_09110 [Chloroflexota bacterium]|nr:hypothetical protein [Chloroflexota bacterium]
MPLSRLACACCRLGAGLAVLLALGRPAWAAVEPPPAAPAGPPYAGWVMVAYPELSTEELRAALGRQLAGGANVVWVGHNNPGEVDATSAEPGLSYAVYEAFIDPAHPRHADATAIVAAQLRLLAVARELGLKVVLPIGYQLEMGAAWVAAHPDDLRRDAAGNVALETGVVNASFYSPAFRRDLRRYYEWVNDVLVRPYRDTLLMLNLADEPTGVDYSAWANRAFAEQTGYTFDEVGDDLARQIALGRFQSDTIVAYARWAAEQWAELAPDLPTTMSFEGATARIHLQLPHVEHLFAQTPPTFFPTFDAYPRDGPPEAAIDDATLVRLFTLVRSLGHYSARYQKPFWLWSAANSWGLAQASPEPGNVADAVANAYYLALLARQTGGELQGIAVWNYNARGQGLYNDTHPTTYDPDTMFARVSESLPRVRQLLAARPGVADVLVVAPDRWPYRLLGATRTSDLWSFRSYSFDRLLALARNNVAAAVVTDLAGEELESVRALIVLARAPEDLEPAAVERLRAFLARGGQVIAGPALRELLGPAARYVEADPVEEAFTDSPSPADAALWREVLGIAEPIQGYYVATEDYALLYSIAPEPRGLRVRLPFAGRGYVAAADGHRARVLALDGRSLEIVLTRSQYAYLTRSRAEEFGAGERGAGAAP